MGEVTSFPRAVQAKDDEVVIFSWIKYSLARTATPPVPKLWKTHEPRRACPTCRSTVNG